ncbi:hypothetical protein MMG85_16145 [Pseudoxanthomonas sp. LH2527]|uniref:hypothetical protein n=1 Tax=Pseudoxanthomonas sp. LH2527 TaxID=2923249 RepID=UPI001F12C04D|nr:hypothetical protein [Pseudoxanthomonas sp. LH2527]MCH6485083.1 hypothetical protein [Pseudoxanthomonas sp. LH2527]
MNRREKMLQGIELNSMIGIEVGPLDKPLVGKSNATVWYVDHCNTEELRRRWSADTRIDIARLHVDAVWGDHTLTASIAAAAYARGENWSGANYLVASHVIEHVPDLIAWLQEVEATLVSGGLVRLAIPDKRYTFDYLRATTTLADCLVEYLRKRRAPSASRILDFTLSAADIDCAEAWHGRIDASSLKRTYTDESAFAIARDAEENGAYHDVHCWSFTPDSFALLMTRLCDLALTSLECEWIIPTLRNDLEFFVGMRRNTNPHECRDSWEHAHRSVLLAEPNLPESGHRS